MIKRFIVFVVREIRFWVSKKQFGLIIIEGLRPPHIISSSLSNTE